MYKIAKRTLIDLNTTKIYLLKVKPRKHDIYVKIVFSVDKDNDCYKEFIKNTLEYITPTNLLFKLEDYEQYLADKSEYDLIENKETMLFTKHTEEDTKHGKELGYSTLFLVPSPHKNLLQQRVKNLIQNNDPKLKLAPSELFTYTEFVNNTNTTRGILKDLKRLQQGKEINTRTTNECWLLKTIKALDLHWN